MAYTLGSAKDARQEPGFTEQDFMNRFAERQAEIVAYKEQHGGDLEGAYQAVTGEPWPEGRSVKIKNGVPQMTKDRTVKSVLGKYVAAPAAIGATALLTGGTGVAPLLSALGSVGGAAGGAAGLGGAAGGAGTLGTIGGIAGAAKTGLGVYNAIRGAGSAVGEATDAAAQNRYTRDVMGQRAGETFEDQLMRRAMFEQQQRGQAMRDVLRAGYLTGGKRPTNLGALDPTATTGVNLMRQAAMKSLEAPTRYAGEQLPELEKFKPSQPGRLERVGNWAAPILSGIGTYAPGLLNRVGNRTGAAPADNPLDYVDPSLW